MAVLLIKEGCFAHQLLELVGLFEEALGLVLQGVDSELKRFLNSDVNLTGSGHNLPVAAEPTVGLGEE